MTARMVLGSIAMLSVLGCGAGGDDSATRPTPVQADPRRVELQVRELQLGHGQGEAGRVRHETGVFTSSEPVAAWLLLDGRTTAAVIVGQWFAEDGTLVEQQSRTLSPEGPLTLRFELPPGRLPPGRYRFNLMINGRSVEEQRFLIEPGAQR